MHPLARSLPYTLVLFSALTLAQGEESSAASENPDAPSNDVPVTLENFTVTEKLNRAREDIVPSLGASSYELDAKQILASPGRRRVV